jgi:hypothetical protein
MHVEQRGRRLSVDTACRLEPVRREVDLASRLKFDRDRCASSWLQRSNARPGAFLNGRRIVFADDD